MKKDSSIFDQAPNPGPPTGAPPCRIESPFLLVSEIQTRNSLLANDEKNILAPHKGFIMQTQPASGEVGLKLKKVPPPIITSPQLPERRIQPPTTQILRFNPTKLDQNATNNSLSRSPAATESMLEKESKDKNEVVLTSPKPDLNESDKENYEKLESPNKVILQTDLRVPSMAIHEEAMLESQKPSNPIKQSLLQAIFGASHEMSANEVWERCKKLPQICKIEILSPAEISELEEMKHTPNGQKIPARLQISHDETPIEFIQEGGITLAVTTNGGFARGVRETLIIVAREFGTALI